MNYLHVLNFKNNTLWDSKPRTVSPRHDESIFAVLVLYSKKYIPAKTGLH
jgi:hypothetical protein